MDNRDYDEKFDDELVDEEFEDSPSYENIEADGTSDFYNQNLNNQIRDIRRKNKGNQSTISKLRQRKANTMSKGVEAPKSTPSSSETPELDEQEEVSKKNSQGIGNKIQEAAKNTANQAKEKVKIAAKETAKKVATKIVMHPYFWIIVGLFLLIMIIPIIWAAFDGDDSSESSSSKLQYVEGFESCNTITVTASDGGGGGTYSLEDYVAGVIVHENYWFEEDNIENMKAQAVAARTYAISRTNNCKNPIPNSQSAQTFHETSDKYAVRAAEETAGQILMKDGSLISTEYDALAIASEDDKNYYLKQQNVAIPKSWLDSRVSQDMYNWYATANHGRGMSQWGARYLQTQGYTYDKILSTFYVDSKLVSINEKMSISNQEFAIRTTKPNIDVLPDKNYYNDTNWFQCPWYAKGRAIEILSTIKLDDEKVREKAIGAVRASNGNGSDWYSLSQNGGTLSMFSSSKDYTKPKAGAIISWRWSDAHYSSQKASGAEANYGHVGIIESVQGNEVIVTDGWNNCGGFNKSPGCQGFAYRKVNIEYLKHFGGNYDFIGYVYLLD